MTPVLSFWREVQQVCPAAPTEHQLIYHTIHTYTFIIAAFGFVPSRPHGAHAVLVGPANWKERFFLFIPRTPNIILDTQEQSHCSLVYTSHHITSLPWDFPSLDQIHVLWFKHYIFYYYHVAFFSFPALFKPRLKATSGDWKVDIMGSFALLFSALNRRLFFLLLTRAVFAYIFHPKINLFLSTTIKINLRIPFEHPMNEYLASGFYSVVFNVYSTFSSDCLNWYLNPSFPPCLHHCSWMEFPKLFHKRLP